MTPVQEAAIPQFLSHKDVVVEAVTGSGKTLAFALPILEILLKKQLSKTQVGAIIVAPTRELASQIHGIFKECLSVMQSSLSVMLFVGGNGVQQDIFSFQKEGGNILVGTPGRLEDLLKRNRIFDCKELEVLVLDEADRLLDMGFQNQLNSIMIRIPKQRRTGLFSATMTSALSQLVKVGLRNPVKIVVKVESIQGGEIKVPESLTVNYKIMNQDSKFAFLANFITQNNSKIIVYLSTCATVDYIYKIFSKLPELKKINLFSLHGKMESKRRNIVFSNIAKAAAPSVLFCTDVAARGLDMPDIDWVIQVDPPQDPEAFNHRCGRTARMGKQGNALVLLTEPETTFIEFLQVKKVPIQELKSEPSNEITMDQLHKFMRNQCLQDRDIYQKSIQAFVSWIRSYNEHEAKYIFRIQNIDFKRLAYSFGLLNLPKTPETRNLSIDYETVDHSVIASIKFADPKRQEAWLRKISAPAEQPKRKKQAWSDKKELKERRLERRVKKIKKKEAIQRSAANTTTNSEETRQELEKEWLELQQDCRNMKKAKNYKSSESDSE